MCFRAVRKSHVATCSWLSSGRRLDANLRIVATICLVAVLSNLTSLRLAANLCLVANLSNLSNLTKVRVVDNLRLVANLSNIRLVANLSNLTKVRVVDSLRLLSNLRILANRRRVATRCFGATLRLGLRLVANLVGRFDLCCCHQIRPVLASGH